jgi:hypothetical protein
VKDTIHTFCSMTKLEPTNANSIVEFIKFSRCPSEYLTSSNERIQFEGTILTQQNSAASTLWSVLSHLKAYFKHSINRDIVKEKPLLNNTLQQLQKKQEQKQAKVKLLLQLY